MKDKRFQPITYILLVVVLLVSMAISYTIGVVSIGKMDAFQLVLSKIPMIDSFIEGPLITQGQETILLNLRMPRVLMATITGATLAVVGAVFQGIFTNTLAEPYVLGVSSGASLGATVAVVFMGNAMVMSFSVTSIFAALGAMITVIFVLFLSSLHGGKMTTMLLTGIAFSYFASSLSTIMMVLNEDKISQLTFWSIGSFAGSSWDKVKLVLPVLLLGLSVIYFFHQELNALSLGEETAIGLGISLRKMRLLLIGVGTIMVAFTVAAAGIIGFVGLIIPSAVRLIFGSNFKHLIPASSLLGGIFLLVCDTVGRVFNEIPAGAITALIGTPIFIYLAIKNARGQVN